MHPVQTAIAAKQAEDRAYEEQVYRLGIVQADSNPTEAEDRIDDMRHALGKSNDDIAQDLAGVQRIRSLLKTYVGLGEAFLARQTALKRYTTFRMRMLKLIEHDAYDQQQDLATLEGVAKTIFEQKRDAQGELQKLADANDPWLLKVLEFDQLQLDFTKYATPSAALPREEANERVRVARAAVDALFEEQKPVRREMNLKLTDALVKLDSAIEEDRRAREL